MFVQIGGIEQWIQIGGENPTNPVLLYLHGGPGGSSRFASAAWKRWEQHFTVVHWDQRGTGLTLEKNDEAGCGPLTIERMIEDGIETVEFLTSHLQRTKIILVGHSWGSVLGIHLIKRRPDLFSAYVGTGQVVNMRRNEEVNYARQMASAVATNNQDAIAALTEIGPPPYFERPKIRILREWADKLAAGSGDHVMPRPYPPPMGFSADAIKSLMRGFQFSGDQLFDELCAVDLPSLSVDFEIPIFFFEGTEDQQTPMELAEAYFATILAPYKEFVRFEGCHHFVAINKPDDFLNELIHRVRPLVV
jgi:pimeloyl-ACP methyl ester carboxylesterase